VKPDLGDGKPNSTDYANRVFRWQKLPLCFVLLLKDIHVGACSIFRTTSPWPHQQLVSEMMI